MSLYFDKIKDNWQTEWNEFVEFVVLTKTNSKENDILKQIKKQIIKDESNDDIKKKIVEEMYNYFEKFKNLEKFNNLEKLKEEIKQLNLKEDIENLDLKEEFKKLEKQNTDSIVSNRIKNPIISTRKNKKNLNYIIYTKLSKTPEKTPKSHEKTPKSPEKTPEYINYIKKEGGKSKSKKYKRKNHGLKKTIHKRLK